MNRALIGEHLETTPTGREKNSVPFAETGSERAGWASAVLLETATPPGPHDESETLPIV